MPSNGAPNIFPYLRYEDAPTALDWLEQTFGFKKIFEVPGPDGTIAHAQLALGPGVVIVGTASPDQGETSPRKLGAVPGGIYVYVEDVQEHFERAQAGGAEIVRELEHTEYDSTEYSALDLEGHHWSFGTFQPKA